MPLMLASYPGSFPLQKNGEEPGYETSIGPVFHHGEEPGCEAMPMPYGLCNTRTLNFEVAWELRDTMFFFIICTTPGNINKNYTSISNKSLQLTLHFVVVFVYILGGTVWQWT